MSGTPKAVTNVLRIAIYGSGPYIEVEHPDTPTSDSSSSFEAPKSEVDEGWNWEEKPGSRSDG